MLLPPRRSDLDAYMERFFKSIKSECLSRKIFFGEKSLRREVREFIVHYHAERKHQGLDNKLISLVDEVGNGDGSLPRRERLGGMLKNYYREATYPCLVGWSSGGPPGFGNRTSGGLPGPVRKRWS